MYFQHLFIFYFRKDKNAAEVHRELYEIYGDNTLTERTYQNCSPKFHCGEFGQRSGLLSEAILVQKLGFIKKIDVWVPHEFKKIHLTQRINICALHFKHNPRFEFRSAARVGSSDHGWHYGFTNFGSQHRQPKMCPIVGSTMAQTRTYCRANFGELL